MSATSFLAAVKAKGPAALLSRGRKIAESYGLTPAQMDRALHQFSEVLGCFNCVATFPVTAVALQRHPQAITRCMGRNIEICVHGLTHVDYSLLDPETQLAHLQESRRVFSHAGIPSIGFRSPYLSRNPLLNGAIETAGFSYASNQPVLWDVLNAVELDENAQARYERALSFYKPWLANQHACLPRIQGNIVEIPVSLPDDEILVDRLGAKPELILRIWQRMLTDSHQRGELFTLQLHPERIGICEDGLAAVLSEALSLEFGVWCAKLQDIAAWWKVRSKSILRVLEEEDGIWRVVVSGSTAVTLLVRGAQVDAPIEPWLGDYQRVRATDFTVRTPKRPFVGISPMAPRALSEFLKELGYALEFSEDRQNYGVYIDWIEFTPERERELIDRIETVIAPVIKLGYWPDGAGSALAITGDIDALTLWDYVWRLLGK